jgi:hypothetical protein
VKSLGITNSTAASADQALTGRFWNGAIQNYWNEIAQTASVAHHLSTAQNARLFALLNLTLAEGVIAFYDAKYTYNFWRPVTAIPSRRYGQQPRDRRRSKLASGGRQDRGGALLPGRLWRHQRNRSGRAHGLFRA